MSDKFLEGWESWDFGPGEIFPSRGPVTEAEIDAIVAQGRILQEPRPFVVNKFEYECLMKAFAPKC